MKSCSWPAWAMLGVGLLVTVFASLQVKHRVETDAVAQRVFSYDQATLKIQERLNAYALILRGAAGLFAASGTVDRQEWRAYVETLQPEKTIPGVQGIGFAQVIPPGQLTAHMAAIRQEGFPDYTVRPPGQRAMTTAIIYLEPFRDRNLRAFGFDMFSEPIRRAAMEQARDTGMAALSGKVELVQETSKEVQAGTLMYIPVYRNGAAVDTLEQKQAALLGWVYSPYRMNDLMAGILRDWEHQEGKAINLHIYDGRHATPAALLFANRATLMSEADSLFQQQRAIDFNGHAWLLVFDHTATATASNINYATAWSTLGGGLALSGLLFGLIQSVINTRANAARIAQALTEQVRRSNAELNRFSEVTAHHLMEPSRRLLVYAQRLSSQIKDRLDDEDTRLSLTFIEQSATRLRDLVRDIERYLAADHPRGPLVVTDWTPLIAALKQRFAARLTVCNAVIETHDLPPAYLDPPRLTDILDVLLDNALIHRAPDVAPRIWISGERYAEGTRLRVDDNGPGIPEEYRQRVLEIFERLAVNPEAGTGIGLAIARRIVESRGGRIWIETSPQGGAAVLIDLPDSSET